MSTSDACIVKNIVIHQAIPNIKISIFKKNYVQWETPTVKYDCFKVSIILTDGMSALYGGHIYNALRGDVMFFRPDELHHARINREGMHCYTDIYIPIEFFKVFYDDLSDWELIFTDNSPDRVNFVSLPTDMRRELLNIADNCEKVMTEDNPRSNTVLFANVIRILELISSFYRHQKARPFQDYTPAAVQSALCYMHENYKTISGLSEIADNCGCSVTYLTKTFRRYTGKTVNAFLTDCRLAYAKSLLSQGCSVTQSCYDAGFRDCSHFIKVFKANEGVTPLVYSKYCRESGN